MTSAKSVPAGNVGLLEFRVGRATWTEYVPLWGRTTKEELAKRYAEFVRLRRDLIDPSAHLTRNSDLNWTIEVSAADFVGFVTDEQSSSSR